MVSAVKWVFYARFVTMSIVKLFNSYEYRRISLNNALWRCQLYLGTILKTWLQDLPSSIFELSNIATLFRLRHSANENLLNIYVPHSLDKQWLEEFVLQITVLNDRRISIAKQKSDSRATQELDQQYHLVHTGNRSLICWQQIQKKILFARIRNETNPWYEFWGRLNR